VREARARFGLVPAFASRLRHRSHGSHRAIAERDHPHGHMVQPADAGRQLSAAAHGGDRWRNLDHVDEPKGRAQALRPVVPNDRAPRTGIPARQWTSAFAEAVAAPTRIVEVGTKALLRKR
jgi:hypothetical protein